MTASSIHRPWFLFTTLAVGLAAIIVIGLGIGRTAAAVQPAGTPAASPSASPLGSPVASPGASPVAGTTDGSNGSPASEAIASITDRVVHNNPILARVKGPSAGDAFFDPFRIFTPDQGRSLAGDARRLTGAGLPTLVYVRLSVESQSQSQEFATSLVQKRGLVESSPGAQDGMVVLLSVRPGAPGKSTFAIAHGANALPVNGLNDAAIQRITDGGVAPRLQKGQLFPAVEYGLREFNYVVAYSPYSTPVLSATARTIGDWLGFIAPLAALAGVALLVVTWFKPGAARRGPVSVAWRAWLAAWWPTLIAGGLCVALIPLSVYARSRIGIFAAAILIAGILLDVWVTADRPGAVHARRIVRVSPPRSGHPVPGRIPARRRRPGGEDSAP